MRIGEAQQIYPEIWQHLDAARKVLVGRGIDVSAFDRIREVEGTSLGADVGLDHRSFGSGSRGVDQQVKSAGFNTQGLGRARQACKALMDATPEIDWNAIAAAEGADPAAAEFGRATRNKRYMMFAALALVIFAPFGIVMYMRHQERAKRDAYRQQSESPAAIELSNAEHARLHELIANLGPQLTSAIAAWPQAFQYTALAAIKPGTAPCPNAVMAPTPAAMDGYVRAGNGDPSFASSDFYGYPGEKPVPGDVLDGWKRTMQSVENSVRANNATPYDRESLEAIKPFITVVVIDKETPAEITGEGSALTYTPGEVLARAFVFSLRDAKIVCAATIDARNTPPQKSRYLDAFRTDRALLHREMELKIREALASGLHAL